MLRSTSTITCHAVRRRRQRETISVLSSASGLPLNSVQSLPHLYSSLPSATPSLTLSGGVGWQNCSVQNSEAVTRAQHFHSWSNCAINKSSSVICHRTNNNRAISNPLIRTSNYLQQKSFVPATATPSFIQKRTKVFVSRHNNMNLDPNQITSYIAQHVPRLTAAPHSDDFRITNSHVVVKECPFCSKPTNGKADNFYKLYISMNGAYFCHRCGEKGSWYDLKQRIGGFSVDGPSCGMPTGAGNKNYGGGQNHSNVAGQPWNWNTSNSNGMNYLSSHQVSNNQNNAKSKVECLPMPPLKSNSIHTSRLFDPTNSSTNNSKEYQALEYLTQTRGLERRVLRKYGVGCANYNFLSNENNSDGSSLYVSSMCVTFPWVMRAKEVEAQEELRGAQFVWNSDNKSDSDGSGRKSGTNGDAAAPSNGRGDSTKKNGRESLNGRSNDYTKKRESEMTPLERYHFRKDRRDRTKAAKAAKNQSNEQQPHFTPNAAMINCESDEHHKLTEEELLSLNGPWIPRRIKVRSVEKKSWQRLDPPGGGFGLFGWHTVPNDATEIIVTEGEFDAMAVYQATGLPAVSLPNGCRSLPMEVLVLLEKFDTVYLWMDNDGPGREGAEMFARKMGVERCLLVQPSGNRGWKGGKSESADCNDEENDVHFKPPPPKDANEALLMGWDINELLEEASELPHDRILKFSDLRDQVIHEIINPEKYRGSPIPSLPGFTSLIKGFRRGELTVVTGPTGSGKTTFLGQISLDLAEQGVNVLWGSFEIKNTRLMHKLLQQYMKDVLPVGLAEKDISEKDRREAMTALTNLADEFDSLPMYFMKFHGGSDVDDVLDAMEYAAYVHDVEHIILDNMQFMISRQGNVGKGSSYDKFDMQDIAIEKFRKFATDYNVHVTLVVHPRKEDEGAKLGISSFYGSAKATQEADTVLILQSDGKRKFLDVKKNRFDGTLGHVPLYFQRKSGRYSENPDIAPPPSQRTVIPSGVSAVNGAQKMSRVKASASSMYEDIRGQHPV